MKRLTKILIGVAIGVLLVAVLILTLVIVLRKEEWIVLERSFASVNDQCTADWSGSSDWKRTRCKMPLICAATKDQSTGTPFISDRLCSTQGIPSDSKECMMPHRTPSLVEEKAYAAHWQSHSYWFVS